MGVDVQLTIQTHRTGQLDGGCSKTSPWTLGPVTVRAWLYDPNGPNAGRYTRNSSQWGTGIGGYNDWYCMAMWEAYVIYFHLKPGTANNIGCYNASEPLDGSSPRTGIGPSMPPYTKLTCYDESNTFPSRVDDPLFQYGGAEAFDVNPDYGVLSTVRGNSSGLFGDMIFQISFSSGSVTKGTKNKDMNLIWRAIRRQPA